MCRKIKCQGANVAVLALMTVAGFMLAQGIKSASALTATVVNPASGSVSGGDIVTITGTDFEPDTPTMQNFGADKCASMDVYDGTNIGALLVLNDPRNDQQYTIGKLADGNCWMLNNLKLGSTTGTITLTSDDTDLNTTSNPNITNNGGVLEFTLPQVATSSPSYDHDNPHAYGPVAGDVGTDETNYGYLYNWSAVTVGESRTTGAAGSGNNNAVNSICPRGWRLPGLIGDGVTTMSDTTASPDNDFSYLNAKMAGFANNQDPAYLSSAGNYYANWQNDGAFRGVFSGYWLNGGFGAQSYDAYLWSRSINPSDSPLALGVAFNTGGVSLNANNDRYLGWGVRCMAQTATTDTNHYDPKPYVSVDGVALDPNDIELVSDTEIRIKMPAHTAGVVNIAITLGATTQTIQYEYLAPDVPAEPTSPTIPTVPNTGVRKNW